MSLAHLRAAQRAQAFLRGSLVRFPCNSSGVCQENSSSSTLLILSVLGLLPIPSKLIMAVVQVLPKTLRSSLCRKREGAESLRVTQVGSSGTAASLKHGEHLLFPDVGFPVRVLRCHCHEGHLLLRVCRLSVKQ